MNELVPTVVGLAGCFFLVRWTYLWAKMGRVGWEVFYDPDKAPIARRISLELLALACVVFPLAILGHL